MKNIIKYLVVAVLISFSSCTDDFEKINTNPHGVSEESLRQMNNHIGGEFLPMFLNVFNALSIISSPLGCVNSHLGLTEGNLEDLPEHGIIKVVIKIFEFNI